MAKVEMRASTTFYNNGAFVNQGDIFKVPEVDVISYESRNLAKRTQAPLETTTPEFAPEPGAYENMTVLELRAIAKERGITGYSNLTKIDLIDAIRSAETADRIERGGEA